MKKLSLFITLTLALLLLVTGQQQAEAQENLLRNPGFEGGFSAWNGIPEVQVAADWTPWWIENVDRDPRWHRPEWKQALASLYPNRVRSGGSSQQWFTFYASHYAGMYQQVFNVKPGQTYRFSIWVQVWSSLEDDAYTSVGPANPHFQIGIEPNGVARPGFASPPSSIVWSYEAPMDLAIDGWAYMEVEATAQSDVITVYMRTSPDFANKHNDIYIDEASLIAVNAAPPPPTAVPPTATSAAAAPTAIPPTAVPATSTPTPLPPTATPSPEPPTETPTAEPTATATTEPTLTASPTAAPTETAEPTATELPPTATAEPAVTETNTPQAVADGSVVDDGGDQAEPPATPTEPSAGFSWWWLLILLPLGAALGWFARGRQNESSIE